MTKTTSMLLMACALLAALPGAAQRKLPTTEAEVPRISVSETQKALQEGGVLIIDVRDAAAYNAGHIAGAVSIPEETLAKSLERLRSEKRAIVTYCA